MTAIAVDFRVGFLVWMVMSGVMPISEMRWRSSWLLYERQYKYAMCKGNRASNSHHVFADGRASEIGVRGKAYHWL
jgi:hypothetical protein